ncbi:MAG: XRE family transcriptional regulator [Alphaproteobacteria bacterium]|nr:XRE family transcriptional regulator [Alphaproteobacteria bacterium]
MLDYLNENAQVQRSSGQIGQDIRALRQGRGWTLVDLAAQLQRSVGWLSQMERGTSEPSLSDIRQIAEIFGLPLSFFFSHSPVEGEAHTVVRAGHRRKITDDIMGLTEELLSPDLGGAFEMVRSVFAPGSAITAPVTRPTEEAGYVVSGNLELTVGKRMFKLNPGDSFRFSGEQMAWRNTGTEDAVVIWVIAPPIY